MKYRSPLTGVSVVMALMLVFASGCHRTEMPNGNLPIVNKALYDTASNFYVGFDGYPEDLRSLPIGIFDSGNGGLALLETLLTIDAFDNITGSTKRDSIRDFAGEHFIYLADMANMPYSNYIKEDNEAYLQELTIKGAIFLTGDDYFTDPIEEIPTGKKPRVKIILMASHTNANSAIDPIRSMLAQSGTGIKLIEVVGAGASAAVEDLETLNPDEPFTIGILATPETIESGVYEQSLTRAIASRGHQWEVSMVNQEVHDFAEPTDNDEDFVNPLLFAPRSTYRGPVLGETLGDIRPSLLSAYNFDFSGNNMLARRRPDGNYDALQLNSTENYVRFSIVTLLERIRRSENPSALRSIILGCPQYSLHLETLRQILAELREYRVDGRYPYRDLIAEEVSFIDPTIHAAMACYRTLREDRNLAFRITPTELDAFITVPSKLLEDANLNKDGGLSYSYKYNRQTGTEALTTKAVHLSKGGISDDNMQRIGELFPVSYSLIATSLK